jgi:hypothetical protein
MNVYLAGVYTSNFNLNGKIFNRLTPEEKAHRLAVKYHLESYHYISRQSFVDKIRADKATVFLDSGAFSAFTKGVKVDIRAYCKYIQANSDIIKNIDGNVCASVLDAIGDAQGTYENQMTMEKLGVRPLPCFHYNEDTRYLDWYVKKYDHITIGGMVPISTPQLIHWLDRIWEKHLTDGAGRPLLKVHAFGVTSPVLMKRYPWYSVDSSSWVQLAAMGNLLIQEKAVAVSEKSPARKIANQHFDNMVKRHQDAIIKIVSDRGFSLERLRVDYTSRWTYNLMAFTEMNDGYEGEYFDRTFINNQRGLF